MNAAAAYFAISSYLALVFLFCLAILGLIGIEMSETVSRRITVSLYALIYWDVCVALGELLK